MMNTEDCDYLLTILPANLQLQMKKKKKNYIFTEYGIRFKMIKHELKLDFIHIIFLPLRRRGFTESIKAYLKIQASRENFEYSDSLSFEIMFENKNSINDRMKKSIVCVPTKNIYDAFEHDLSSISAPTNYNDNNDYFECIPEESPDGVRDSDNLCLEEDGTVMLKTTCLVLNCIDFENHALKRRAQSMIIVDKINLRFGSWCNCAIKGKLNTSQNDVNDMINELKQITGQVIIFIMTHGDNDGFHLTDGYVQTKEFLVNATNNKLRMIFILGYCQKINNSFLKFLDVNNSSSDDDNDDKHCVLETVLHVKCLFDHYLKDFVSKNDIKIFIGMAAQPGGLSNVGKNGSFYISTILNNMKIELFEKKQCDFIEIIKKSSQDLQDIIFLYKSKETSQKPWYVGNLDSFKLNSTEENIFDDSSSEESLSYGD